MIRNNIFGKFKDSLFGRWVVCGIISDKKSVKYGLYFSYPVYILLVLAGVLLKNLFILLIAALIAFLAIKLPLHPFDYVYNFVAKLIRQVNSLIALVFNLIVVAFITFGISINYVVLAIVYALSSIFFIGIFLFQD